MTEMSERFMVVPVDRGDARAGEDRVDGDSVFLDAGAGEDERRGSVPILEYSREPNRFARLRTSNLNSNKPRREGETERDKNGSRSETHGENMPTSFTVVPVDDGRRCAQEDTDENNVLKEEDEEAVGELLCPQGIFGNLVCVSKQASWMSSVLPRVYQTSL
ncbi:hypothetical protein E1301_Tti019159 [Triplophysa tibetana]|uniref:Uncharacterized protein n=1 Tax=Triplophysa tibetana TaxID=1572043 RepID=A0A5A9N5V0_9TELE|nr:hypothetical protein E1301_Tti019159 [Triplophysa tibetana]